MGAPQDPHRLLVSRVILPAERWAPGDPRMEASMDTALNEVRDSRKHKNRLKRYLAADTKDLKRAESRLMSFETLAKDATWGNYYREHVKFENSRIQSLRKSVARWQSSLLKTEQRISTLQQTNC